MSNIKAPQLHSVAETPAILPISKNPSLPMLRCNTFLGNWLKYPCLTDSAYLSQDSKLALDLCLCIVDGSISVTIKSGSRSLFKSEASAPMEHMEMELKFFSKASVKPPFWSLRYR